MNQIKKKLFSRKFWLVVSGCITVLATEGFTSSALWKVVVLIVGGCASLAYVDRADAEKKHE
jgi:hypothetical protein